MSPPRFRERDIDSTPPREECPRVCGLPWPVVEKEYKKRGEGELKSHQKANHNI